MNGISELAKAIAKELQQRSPRQRKTQRENLSELNKIWLFVNFGRVSQRGR
jgi:hypothetical protein